MQEHVQCSDRGRAAETKYCSVSQARSWVWSSDAAGQAYRITSCTWKRSVGGMVRLCVGWARHRDKDQNEGGHDPDGSPLHVPLLAAARGGCCRASSERVRACLPHKCLNEGRQMHILHCHVTVGTRKRAFHIMGNDYMFTLRIPSPERLEGIRINV